MISTITSPLDIVEDTRVYYSEDFAERVLEELFYNAYRTIQNVYLFKHFDEYIDQLKANENEDKKEVYWNASYYEKLNDYIKISIAFENYNKAILIQKGYMVHKIQKTELTKDLFKKQNNGEPVTIAEFRAICNFIQKRPFDKFYLEGLQNGFPTITYSKTLNESYQKIIGLDPDLLYHLKGLNDKRNKLHFFTDFKGAFKVDSHIEKWTFIKEKALHTFDVNRR
jgi:hypothetical protein